MSKKNFRNNPALSFISAPEETPSVAHYEEQLIAHVDTHVVHETIAQDHAQEVTRDEMSVFPSDGRKNYIRTQGRKGYKKPRINLAFDSDAFLDMVRVRAEREGKSITQFVNDAVAYYLETTKIKNKN